MKPLAKGESAALCDGQRLGQIDLVIWVAGQRERKRAEFYYGDVRFGLGKRARCNIGQKYVWMQGPYSVLSNSRPWPGSSTISFVRNVSNSVRLMLGNSRALADCW